MSIEKTNINSFYQRRRMINELMLKTMYTDAIRNMVRSKMVDEIKVTEVAQNRYSDAINTLR